MTTPATVQPDDVGRANYLKRLNGKVAKRAARTLYEEGNMYCAYCGKPIVFLKEAKLYRPPSEGEPHAAAYPTFTLSDGTIAVMGHKVCPLPKR